MSAGATTGRCPIDHEFDPFGAEFQSDPARTMRDAQPVFYSEIFGWCVVTWFADIRAVFSDTQSFSSQNFAAPVVPLATAAVEKLAEYDYVPARSLSTIDEPIHLLRRRKLAEPFKAKNTGVWEPRIREVQTEYIDRFADRGHADLVSDLFWEAPAVVAMDFMGIPQEDREKVKTYGEGLMHFLFGRPTEQDQVETADMIGRSQQYARELFARLKEDPSGPGFLPMAVRAYLAEPDVFDEDFIVALGVNTLAAAHETTSGSLANAVVLLLSHLDAWDAICADPTLIPGAAEECLRVSPSLVTNRRLCVKDTVIGGVPIPAGAQVLLGTAAGSVDPEAFEDPDTLDITRANAKSQMVFGYGAHFCLGAPLARLQMKVALEELTGRLPHMRLVTDQEFDYPVNSSARSPRSILVGWDPEQNPHVL